MENSTWSVGDSSMNRYLSDRIISFASNNQFDDNPLLIKLTKSAGVEKICPQNQSDRDEEIKIVQSLRTRIEPNHDVSQTVSKAVARLEERVHRHVEIIENEFKSIDNEIGRRIKIASQRLDESLVVIDNSLSSILENINSGDLMQFDLLQKSFTDVDDLINKRNQIINNFVDVTRELEKERTALIDTSCRQYMFDIKQLSVESFEWLFEKYLKDYNTIKLGNFRTYEDLRFKLVLMSGNIRRDFVLRAYDVKMSIKMNITEFYRNKFRTSAETIISDIISSLRTNSIGILNDSNELIDNLTCQAEKQINFAIILEGSTSLKTLSIKIDETVDSMLLLLLNKVSEDVQSLSAITIEELDRIMKDSGESLSQDELTAIAEEMSSEVDCLRQDVTETIAEFQLLLKGVKDTIRVIDKVLGLLTTIIYGHLKRLTKARNTILEGLRAKSNFNDTKLNILINDFDVAFDSLVEASTETEVLMFEKKCNGQLKYIEKRKQINRDSEMYIISKYKNIMTSEFDKISVEVQRVLKSFPEVLKSLPEFSGIAESEFWAKSIETSIIPFKAAVDNFQKTLHKRLLTLITELKSSDLFTNDSWTKFLANCIEDRCVSVAQLLEQRAVKIQDGIAKKRTDEIKQHQNDLERHIKAAQEICENLQRKTDELYEESDRQKIEINRNVELIQSNIDELSILELSEKTNKLIVQVDSVANELNEQYKLHCKTVESGYQAIENSTSEFIKSSKLFSEGGNYGHEEAIIVIDALNDLKHIMLEKQTEIMDLLKQMSSRSLSEAKKTLSKSIKPVEIQLDKKILEQKCYAINRLMTVTVNQELLNLEKMIDSLHTKLCLVEKTFEKDDVAEMSKSWSEILMETQNFVDYFFESYLDIRVLLKSQTRNTIWNSKLEDLKISEDSENMFLRGESKFYDYCETVVNSTTGTDVGARFLNNIYLTVRQYVLESQTNAADIALTESANIWITERSDIAQVYREIMDETLKKSHATVLQAELIWILKLSDFCNFLRNGLHVAEMKFKNIVLATYHEESLARLAQAFGSFSYETESTRRRLKVIRDEFCNKLKVSHGHPNNTQKLEALMDEFHLVRSECEDSLQDICVRTKICIEKLADNYETMCPEDVMRAATMSVKCHSSLRTRLGSVNTTLPNLSVDNEYEAISESLANQITVKHAVEQAVNNIKQYTSEIGAGIVFWSVNNQVRSNNLQMFLKSCQDLYDDVQTFETVEKSKIIDWATMFIQDVERVKKLY